MYIVLYFIYHNVLLYTHTGADPYSLLEQSYDAISRRLGTFRTRVHKQTPAGIDSFGYVCLYITTL